MCGSLIIIDSRSRSAAHCHARRTPHGVKPHRRTPPTLMMDPTFHDFLVEHAKFPFPDCSMGTSASSTRLSEVDVGYLDDEWKALHAVRDNDLTNKLCGTLKTTLGEMTVTEDSRSSMLPWFLPASALPGGRMVDRRWTKNPSEAHVSVIIPHREFKLSLWDRARRY